MFEKSDGGAVMWLALIAAAVLVAMCSCAGAPAVGAADPTQEQLDLAFTKGKVAGICEAICKIRYGTIQSRVSVTPEGKLRCDCDQVGD